MNRLLWISSGFALAILVLLAVTTAPAAQTPLTTDQQILLTLDSLQTVDAMLWGTLDGFSISTQVATLVATAAPATITPTATNELPFATPTIEDWTTATPVPGVTVTAPPDEPQNSVRAYVITQAGLNIRLCPSTSCAKYAHMLEYGDYTYVWRSTCGYYRYNKVLDRYERADAGTIEWCQLNVTGTQDYWIAVRVGSTIYARLE